MAVIKNPTERKYDNSSRVDILAGENIGAGFASCVHFDCSWQSGQLRRDFGVFLLRLVCGHNAQVQGIPGVYGLKLVEEEGEWNWEFYNRRLQDKQRWILR